MRIGIDVRTLFKKDTKGLGAYCNYLLEGLQKIDSKNQYILFYNEDDTNRKLTLPVNFFLNQCAQKGGERFFLWEQYRLPKEIKRNKIDIFHFPTNTVSCFALQDSILTLHDMLMFEEDQANFKGKQKFYIHYFQPHFISKIKRIITVSEFSKKRIIDRLKVAPERITVIYNGISEMFKQIEPVKKEGLLRNLGIEGDYIFTVGANSKRKNISALLKAYLNLLRNTPLKEKLVISGINQATRNDLNIEIPWLSECTQIVFLPYIAHEELIALYNGAKLFVFPSIAEGFGFPPLEAMACGVPVIASYYTSIPEVLGDSAYLVDTKEPSEISKAIKLLLENDFLRREYSEKGLKRAKNFSWLKTAQETLQVYENFAKESGIKCG